MENIVITGKQLLAALSVIVTLGAVEVILRRWFKPFKDLKERVSKLEENQNSDHKRLKDVEDGQTHFCKAMLALIDHSVSGNSIEKLKKAKEDLQNYLIEK